MSLSLTRYNFTVIIVFRVSSSPAIPFLFLFGEWNNTSEIHTLMSKMLGSKSGKVKMTKVAGGGMAAEEKLINPHMVSFYFPFL